MIVDEKIYWSNNVFGFIYSSKLIGKDNLNTLS